MMKKVNISKWQHTHASTYNFFFSQQLQELVVQFSCRRALVVVFERLFCFGIDRHQWFSWFWCCCRGRGIGILLIGSSTCALCHCSSRCRMMSTLSGSSASQFRYDRINRSMNANTFKHALHWKPRAKLLTLWAKSCYQTSHHWTHPCEETAPW